MTAIPTHLASAIALSADLVRAESLPAMYVETVDVNSVEIRDALAPQGLVSQKGKRPTAMVAAARLAYRERSGVTASGAVKAIERLTYVAAICASHPRAAGLDEKGSAKRQAWVLKVRSLVNTGLTLEEVSTLVARGLAGSDPIAADTPKKGTKGPKAPAAPVEPVEPVEGKKVPVSEVAIGLIEHMSADDLVTVLDVLVLQILTTGVPAGRSEQVEALILALGEVTVAA